jgi:hypothetical protein
MRWMVLAFLLTTTPAVAQTAAPASIALMTETGFAAATALLYSRDTYAGRDSEGAPHYTERPFSLEERRLLREHFGIEEPGRLYLSDSSAAGYLMYDTERDPGTGRLVRTYVVGAESIRHHGETWEELERRLAALRSEDFPESVQKPGTSLAALDPVARPAFERMLREARRAGHRVRVAESYRSPERQAWLLVKGGGVTFTATSKHSAGRAVDVIVGNGDLGNAKTRARWAAFRKWVRDFEGGRFRLIGEPAKSWDWPHIELAAGIAGYGSIEELLNAARLADSACCDVSGGDLHSTHDPARSGATSLAGPRSGSDQVRIDGPAGGAAVPAR